MNASGQDKEKKRDALSQQEIDSDDDGKRGLEALAFQVVGEDLDIASPAGGMGDEDLDPFGEEKAEAVPHLSSRVSSAPGTPSLSDFKAHFRPLDFNDWRRCAVEGCERWIRFVTGQAHCPACGTMITIVAPGLCAALSGGGQESAGPEELGG